MSTTKTAQECLEFYENYVTLRSPEERDQAITIAGLTQDEIRIGRDEYMRTEERSKGESLSPAVQTNTNAQKAVPSASKHESPDDSAKSLIEYPSDWPEDNAIWPYLAGDVLPTSSQWNLPAAQARIVAAYEIAGISQNNIIDLDPWYLPFTNRDIRRDRLPKILPMYGIELPTNKLLLRKAKHRIAALSWMYGREMTHAHYRTIQTYCAPLQSIIIELSKGASFAQMATQGSANIDLVTTMTTKAMKDKKAEVARRIQEQSLAMQRRRHALFERLRSETLAEPDEEPDPVSKKRKIS